MWCGLTLRRTDPVDEKDELIRTMLSMLQDLHNNYGWDQLASTLEDVEQAAQELGVKEAP